MVPPAAAEPCCACVVRNLQKHSDAQIQDAMLNALLAAFGRPPAQAETEERVTARRRACSVIASR
jgi:hypothetical protein